MTEILIFAAAMIFWGAFILGLSKAMRKQERAVEQRYKTAHAKAQNLSRELSQVIRIFTEHDVRYFQTLNSSGLPELKEIEAALNMALVGAEALFNDGQIDEATVVSQWICDQNSGIPDKKAVPTRIQAVLTDWRERSRIISIECTQAVSETAHEYETIGVTRERMKNRRPTLMNLQEIRRMILPN